MTAVEDNYIGNNISATKDQEKDAAATAEAPPQGDCKLRGIFQSTPKPDVTDPEKQSLLADQAQLSQQQSRSDYILGLEHKEINDGIGEFPSLDPETQMAITLEYRALHEQVKTDGLYECRYSEYGKELIRYSLLFLCFISLLRSGWYLTSALFLGMFWVCFDLSFDCVLNHTNIRSSNKSCSLPTMQATGVSQETSLSTP